MSAYSKSRPAACGDRVRLVPGPSATVTAALRAARGRVMQVVYGGWPVIHVAADGQPMQVWARDLVRVEVAR